MRYHKTTIVFFMAGAFLSWWLAGLAPALANTTITLDQSVHFMNAEGSDVVLEAGQYELASADTWLRVTPSEGQAVDALLLEAQVAKHEESLKAPLAISATGEEPDTLHLALLLLGGKRLEAIGSYSGLRSRGTLSLLTIQRLRTLSSTSQSTTPTEFKTPLFGGSGGNRSYNLDCGNRSVLVGAIYKAGSWLDAIGIICQRVNPQNGSLGDEFTRGPLGGSGGNARIKRCDEGKVVHGVRGFSGQFVNGILLNCSRWDASQKSPSVRRTQGCSGEQCVFFGRNNAGASDTFLCPRGKVGKAFRGKYGIYIDSSRFVCDLWDK